MHPITVIIPTFNEQPTVVSLVHSLIEQQPLEILIADGESTDGTPEACDGLPETRSIRCPRGRAAQMNFAARQARGEILLFLHADVEIPAGALAAIASSLRDPDFAGGHFDILFAGGDRIARIFSSINRIRYRFGIFYGDSGIFCRKSVFERMGGYQPWPILEDYEFARRLRRFGKIASLPLALRVSDRRWRRGGLFNTLWAWFWIQALYLA